MKITNLSNHQPVLNTWHRLETTESLALVSLTSTSEAPPTCGGKWRSEGCQGGFYITHSVLVVWFVFDFVLFVCLFRLFGCLVGCLFVCLFVRLFLSFFLWLFTPKQSDPSIPWGKNLGEILKWPWWLPRHRSTSPNVPSSYPGRNAAKKRRGYIIAVALTTPLFNWSPEGWYT